MRGRSLGIIGYGNIGSQLSVLAESLGMRVVFYDTADKLALGNARRCEYARRAARDASDSSRCTSTGGRATRGLFGEALFSRMRPGSIFLNLSRGFVVDHAALRRPHRQRAHRRRGARRVPARAGGAPGDAFESELRGLPNVILTPHIGGSTEEAQQDIGGSWRASCVDYVDAGTTR